MKTKRLLSKCLGSVMAIILLCMLSFSSFASAQENFTTSRFDVDVTVHENNIYDITEKIEVYFTQPSHGIYRYIPYTGRYYRESSDGKVENQSWQAKIDHVAVNGYSFETSRENGNMLIKIGDAESFVSGKQVYTISYRVDMGEDKYTGQDIFYYNVLPFNWATSIENATVSITMPKNFAPANAEILMGQQGRLNGQPQWESDGKTIKITGSALLRGEGITADIKLDDGYFVGARNNRGIAAAAIILSLVLAAGAAVLLQLFGRDKKLIPTVEFYPPAGMTSAEAGYIIDSSVQDRDIVSLIIYWADKGYLTIKPMGKDNLQLTKLQPLPANAKAFENTVFNGLFKDGDSITTKDLKGTFYQSSLTAKTQVSSYFNTIKENRLFTSLSKSIQLLLRFLLLLPLAFILLLYGIHNGYPDGALFPAIGCVALAVIVLLFSVYLEKWDGKGHKARIAGTAGFIAVNLALTAVCCAIFYSYFEQWLPLAFACLSSIGIGILAGFVKQRTPQGQKWMEQLLGLKDFITLAEKDRINALVEESPSYFYRILPFAYVLGVTDRWAKKFEDIAIDPPGWYDSSFGPNFTTLYFMHAFTRNMQTMQTNLTIPPANTNSGSFTGGGGFSGGGGGFSGGGAGGGGGGSW